MGALQPDCVPREGHSLRRKLDANGRRTVIAGRTPSGLEQREVPAQRWSPWPRHDEDELAAPLVVPVAEGAGLGLYLCQNLSNLLGGSLYFSSEFGKGSVFTLALAAKGA